MTWIEKIVKTSKHCEEYIRELYLESRTTCVPVNAVGDDVHDDIYDLFYYPLGVIRDEAYSSAIVVIEPSYEDTTGLYILDLDSKKVLWHKWIKAWTFWFESEKDFDEWCDGIAKALKEARDGPSDSL